MAQKKNNDLRPGDKAPDFCLPGANLKATFECMRDFGGGWVVVYFYPEDFTQGCTIEAKEFSVLLPKFAKAGSAVVGISPDTPEKHVDFCSEHFLKLDLLSDVSHSIMKKFGVWKTSGSLTKRKVYGVERSTFLIDPSGTLRAVWRNVNPAGHASIVLAELKRLKGM